MYRQCAREKKNRRCVLFGHQCIPTTNVDLRSAVTSRVSVGPIRYYICIYNKMYFIMFYGYDDDATPTTCCGRVLLVEQRRDDTVCQLPGVLQVVREYKYIYINVSCVCVLCECARRNTRNIYIYLGTNHAGEIRSRVFMHDDVVVSDSRHVSRSGLRHETRQRVKTPIVTRGNSYTSVVLFFIIFSLATCQNRKRRTTQKSDTRWTATMHIIYRTRRRDQYNCSQILKLLIRYFVVNQCRVTSIQSRFYVTSEYIF